MTSTNTSPGNSMALDVGAARIGVAVAHDIARLPQPLMTLSHDSAVFDTIAQLVQEQEVNRLVVGLPRGMDGHDTEQTRQVREFAAELQRKVPVVVHFQDEAVTSVQAEKELQQSKKAYQKADIDARAAVLILEDFLNQEGQQGRIRR